MNAQELQRRVDRNRVIYGGQGRRSMTNQFLRRTTDRDGGEGNRHGRRFTDGCNRHYMRLGRSFRTSLNTMPWYEVWALAIHTILLVLHAAIVIASMMFTH